MDQDNQSKSPPIEIAASQLGEDTVKALVQEFILREGTDYGWVETSLEEKVAQVFDQLQKNEIGIYFDPETESATLRVRESLQRTR